MQQKQLWVVLLMGFLVVLLAVLIWFFMGSSAAIENNKPNAQGVVTQLASSQNANNPQAASVVASNASQLPPLPKSLQGTQVDGEIIIDDNKQLVVTYGLRRLFDYFLSAQGEESLATISQRINDYIKRHTPEPAAGQALKIYQQYLTYLKGVADIDKNLPATPTNDNKSTSLDLAQIKQREQDVIALRQRLFDANTIQAFFGSEMALNRYTLQTMQIQQNPNLSDVERQTALAKALQQYTHSFADPAVRQQITEQQTINTLLAETERLKRQGASEAEINAMRRQYIGEEAVQRLTELDRTEAAFEQRVIDFNRERQQILAQQGNTPQAQQAIQYLQQQRFSETEQLRLNAVAKILADKPSQTSP